MKELKEAFTTEPDEFIFQQSVTNLSEELQEDQREERQKEEEMKKGGDGLGPGGLTGGAVGVGYGRSAEAKPKRLSADARPFNASPPNAPKESRKLSDMEELRKWRSEMPPAQYAQGGPVGVGYPPMQPYQQHNPYPQMYPPLQPPRHPPRNPPRHQPPYTASGVSIAAYTNAEHLRRANRAPPNARRSSYEAPPF